MDQSLRTRIETYVSRLNSLIGIFIITSLPFVVYHATISYVDLPLAAYNLAAVIFIFNYMKTGNKKYIWVASLLSSCALWTKSEGLVYLIINSAIFGCVMFYAHKDQIRNAAYILAGYLLLPIFTLYLPWNIYKFMNTLSFSESLSFAGKTNYSERLFQVLSVFTRKLFLDGNWNIFWILVLLVVIFRLPRILKGASLFPLLLVVSYLIFFIGFYLFSGPGVFSFVLDGTVLCRNFIPITLVGAFILAVNLTVDERIQ